MCPLMGQNWDPKIFRNSYSSPRIYGKRLLLFLETNEASCYESETTNLGVDDNERKEFENCKTALASEFSFSNRYRSKTLCV